MRWLALLVLVGCTDGELPSVDGWIPGQDTDNYSDAEVPAPLNEEIFDLCTDRTEITYDALLWCDFVKDLPRERCPAFFDACTDQRFAVEAGGCDGQGDAEAGGLAGLPDDDDDPFRYLTEDAAQGCDAADSPQLSLPGLRWLAAFGVALLILLIMRKIAENLGWLQEPVRIEEVGVVIDVIEGDDDLPALPEDELLALARQAFERGELGEAVVYARGAALRRLARRGLLTLHRARTDREYLRGLRQQPETRGWLGTVLNAVEDHRWAGRELTTETARQALESATRILVVALLMVLPTLSQAASDRHGPNGDVAIRRIFDELGYDTSSVLLGLDALDDDIDVVVIDTRGVLVREEETRAVRAWVRAGGLLILAGEREAGFREAAVGQEAYGGEPTARGRWEAAGLPVPRYRSSRHPLICVGKAHQVWVDVEGATLSGVEDTGDTDSEEPEGSDCIPASISGKRVGDGFIVRIAESTLLWNTSFLEPANREWLEKLLPWGVDEGLWDLPEVPRILLAMRSVEVSDDPLESLSEARLLPFVLQLLVAWLLLALWRGWPFTPRRDPAESGRLAFTDHVMALAAHWERLGAWHHATQAYARLILRRLTPAGLATAAMRHGYTEEQARDLAERTQRSAAGKGAEDLRLVEELWKTTRHR